jgi:26S proteasome regulatory subunit T1
MWIRHLRKVFLYNMYFPSYSSLTSYVPVHLEYILTEVLKNSYRASVEHHHNLHGGSSHIPVPGIIATIAPSTRLQGQPAYLSLRVRDEGGGIPSQHMEKIFSYAFTTAGRNASQNSDESHENSNLTADGGIEGGPYAAQHVGGMAAIDDLAGGDGNLFGEITGKGLQSGLGTIAGLGYG